MDHTRHWISRCLVEENQTRLLLNASLMIHNLAVHILRFPLRSNSSRAFCFCGVAVFGMLVLLDAG